MKSTLFVSAIVTLVCIGASSACSDDSDSNAPVGTPSGDGGDGDSGGGNSDLTKLAVACADPETAVYGEPGPIGDRGAILKCSTAPEITADALKARATALGYKGTKLTSGARVYKVLYATERGGKLGKGTSSAVVFVPTTPREGKLPIIVGAHGTRGQAGKCASSKFDILGGEGDGGYLLQALPLVGAGFPVIIPDLPGYANFGATGNPPNAYAEANDGGKATLDGSRALKNLFPTLEDKVVLIGHSQGGHTALAALSLADSYGAQGPIVGAAVYAPLWLSQRSWGAILEPGVGQTYPIAESAIANAVTVWYHYTHAELLDGPGEGLKLFAPDKQAAVKQFIENDCIAGSYPTLEGVAQYSYELFDSSVASAVGGPAAFGSPCNGNAICEKWIKRYTEDRPHLTGAAAQVPILMLYGGKDTTIPPNRMKCSLDRLVQDKANLTMCFEAADDHSSILATRGEYVTDWIASVTLGAPAPQACAAGAEAVATACATPPPND